MKINGERDLWDTPCEGTCTASALGDKVCKGCGRTFEEVRDWNLMSVQKKIEINERLKNAIKS